MTYTAELGDGEDRTAILIAATAGQLAIMTFYQELLKQPNCHCYIDAVPQRHHHGFQLWSLPYRSYWKHESLAYTQ